ncbi:MAG: rRNA maturation RNase YbeY [Desulfobacteraceae bacterium]|nr:rRNA maturation RNase YbeY [Desulfobacteraceae bacterium]
MEVLIKNQQNLYQLSEESIKSTAYTLLEALGKTGAELSLLIVDDGQIAQINKTYLDRTGPTNVIAFPMGDDGFAGIRAELLGDVVISVETAGREASDAGYSMEERFTELLIHGILHLLGYDHETNEQDAEQMNQRSEELMHCLKARKEQ